MPWPVDEKFICESESRLEVKFPEDYRQSLLKQNGGEVLCEGGYWIVHPVWDKSDKKRLKRTSNDVVRETKVKKDWARWPISAICIASDGTGDALIFITKNNVCEPRVLLWNHETGETSVVADKFSDLEAV